MIGEMQGIADRCDGVRCDMAMLLLPEVIARTWGGRSQPADGAAPVEAPFWPEAIAAVQTRRPDFLFLAEVYWDLEWELQQEGFDYTYDKRLYDRLRAGDAAGVRAHLSAGLDFQRRCARFLENHDEAAPPPRFRRGCTRPPRLSPISHRQCVFSTTGNWKAGAFIRRCIWRGGSRRPPTPCCRRSMGNSSTA